MPRSLSIRPPAGSQYSSAPGPQASRSVSVARARTAFGGPLGQEHHLELALGRLERAASNGSSAARACISAAVRTKVGTA